MAPVSTSSPNGCVYLEGTLFDCHVQQLVFTGRLDISLKNPFNPFSHFILALPCGDRSVFLARSKNGVELTICLMVFYFYFLSPLVKINIEIIFAVCGYWRRRIPYFMPRL